MFVYNSSKEPTKKRPTSERRHVWLQRNKMLLKLLWIRNFSMHLMQNALIPRRPFQTNKMHRHICSRHIWCWFSNWSFFYWLRTSFDTEMMDIDTECSSSEDTVLCSSFHPTETEDSYFELDRHLPPGAMLIVYWSSLLQLLCKCLRCSVDAVIQNVRRCGSAFTVKLYCKNEHSTIWRTQPFCNPLLWRKTCSIYFVQF